MDSVLKDNPYIDKHIVFDTVEETLPILEVEKYDCIVDLQKNRKSTLLSWILGVKRYTFDKLNFKKWLYTRLKLDLIPNVHIVDRYFESVAHLGIKNDGRGLDYFIHEDDVETAKKWKPQSKYRVLVLGATYATKRIPDDKCIEIIERSSIPIVLVGGKDVIVLGKKLNERYREKTIDVCGQCNLGVSAAIIRDAEDVVTADTGLMHIAAALRKKIHMIWGNTTPKLGMYPYYGHLENQAIHYEVKNLSCRPCSKLGYQSCPQGHFKCMMNQDFSSFC
jgi:ADP-heptose:LPS heptosyltransferase